MTVATLRAVFLAAAIYDMVLGFVFGLFWKPIYAHFGATLPNHAGYVQLPAAFIFIFGIGFCIVAQDPERNRAIIPLGVLMKLAFVVIVLGHTLAGEGLPFLMPFAMIDLVFAILFAFGQMSLGRQQSPTTQTSAKA